MKHLLAVLSLLALATPAHATSPTGRALIAGGITAGSELAGGAVGAAVGAMLGNETCNDQETGTCSGTYTGLFLGGLAGMAVGGNTGAALGSRVVHARPLRTMGFASIGLGAGIGLVALGNYTDTDGLATAGMVVLLAGMPVGAGVAAATDVTAIPKSGSAQLMITPHIQGGNSGVRISGRF